MPYLQNSTLNTNLLTSKDTEIFAMIRYISKFRNKVILAVVLMRF